MTMGSDPHGRLAYGFGLGSDEDIDTDNLPWFVEEDGLCESIERALLASVGFTETWETTEDREGYHARQRAAQERLGVKVVWTGTWEFSGYILAAIKHEVEWSDTWVVDLTLPDEADEKLARAIEALPGLKPTNDEPAWLLAAFYG